MKARTDIAIEIVVVDDDPLMRETIAAVLGDRYEVHPFADPAAAEQWMERQPPSLALLDLNLQSRSGLDVLAAWKRRFPALDVVICSGEVRVDRAVECLRSGASDYVVKPFEAETLLFLVARALEKVALKRRVETLGPLLKPHPVELVGSAPALEEVRRRVTPLRGQTQLNVMILGESGTGKEVVARLLHQQEGDPERPFVAVNMPAIPATLMEAELFGVEKGAFTDAKHARCGKFEMAHGGDVFLDEIGDLAPETQAKLLRTLQERQVERLGATRPRRIDFRVLCATNQSPGDLVTRGRFREDLLYRLNDMVLWMPPLRDRLSDIPELVEHFVRKYARPPQPRFGEAALARLAAYRWPGNVRQLESTVKRALAFADGPVIERVEIIDLSSPGAERPVTTLAERLLAHERRIVTETVARHRGDKAAAMAELGLPRATFYRKLQQLGIEG